MDFSGFSCDELTTLVTTNDADAVFGEEIKPHTETKIKYVAKYVEEWLYVMANFPDSKDIYFIDIMCNAGIYANHRLSTSIEVLNTFVKCAQKHKDKRFFLLANDYDDKKVETMRYIYQIYQSEFDKRGINNISMQVDCSDACDYLSVVREKYRLESTRYSKKSVLLYVDPYNLVDSRLASSVKEFLTKNYCELVLNFYINDFSRNMNNKSAGVHRDVVKDFVTNFCGFSEHKQVTALQLRERFISLLLENTKMKYRYVVTMKNSMNAPLYYLVYLTPKYKGLAKVKEATFKTFGYHDSYCVSRYERDQDEENLLGETPEEEAFAVALESLENVYLKDYSEKELTFEELAIICLENTFMKESHIIERVIKPLMKKNKLVKVGVVQKNNYKQDDYLVKSSTRSYLWKQ